MTDDDEVFPGRWPVDEDAWTAKLGASGLELASLRSGLEGLVIEPFYRAPSGMGDAPVTRTPTSPWRVAQAYAWPDGGAEGLQRALGVDATFGLEHAWVRLPEAVRRGSGADGQAWLDDVVRLAEASGGAPHVSFDAGLGAALLSSRQVERGAGSWSIVSDPIGLVLELGALDVPLEAAIASGLADGPGRRWMASGVVLHDAGATAVHELGAAIASVLAYVRLSRIADTSGSAVAQFLARGVLRLAVGTDLFVDVAKLRAARWLWRGIATHLGAPDQHGSIAVESSVRHRTAAAAELNLVRGMNEAWSAIVGGADELVISPYDELLGTSEAGRRWALTTQLILREESQLGAVADPLAGSAYVEALTHVLAREAWAFARTIEAQGGIAQVVRSGWLQSCIADDAAALRDAFEHGRHALVGVTLFPEPGGAPPVVLDDRQSAGLPPLRLESLRGPT